MGVPLMAILSHPIPTAILTKLPCAYARLADSALGSLLGSRFRQLVDVNDRRLDAAVEHLDGVVSLAAWRRSLSKPSQS
jgi:hypothetical protein